MRMTDPIQNRSTPLSFGPPAHPPLTPPGLGARLGEAGLDAYLATLPLDSGPTAGSTSATASFVRAQTTPVAAYTVDARSTAVQAKLDAFMQEATPTYHLPDGSSIAVPAFFRMAGENAFHSPKLAADRPVRDALAKSLGVQSNVEGGRPSLGDIRKLTQGLIDAGRLGPSTGGSTLQVRQMVWDHGVGIDCAAYVQRALFASQGGDAARYGLQSLNNEDLMSLKWNSKWQKVGIEEARPGDLVTLAANGQDCGHTTIVYEHQFASPTQRDAFRATLAAQATRDPRVVAVLDDPKLQVFQLDSSWGAGPEPSQGGGVERRTWLYAPAGGWLCQQRNGHFTADGPTPCGHTLGGPFRAKVQS
jgi:hypothetical protein